MPRIRSAAGRPGAHTPPPRVPSRGCDKQTSVQVAVLSRRNTVSILLSGFVATQSLPSNAAVSPGDWATPGLAAPEDEFAPKFFKKNGVAIQELNPGSGSEARRGDRVLVDYVLRRSNGYFIYATIEGVSFQPKDLPTGPISLVLDDSVTIPGLVEALEGMHEGGKRRILVPPALGYEQGSSKEPKMPTFSTQRQVENHRQEPLLFELQLRRVISKLAANRKDFKESTKDYLT